MIVRSVEKVDSDLYEVRDDRGELLKSFLGPDAKVRAQAYANRGYDPMTFGISESELLARAKADRAALRKNRGKV